MKNLLTLLSLIITINSYSQIDSANFTQIITTPNTIAIHGDASHLYLKKNDSKSRKRIKKGATAQIKTKTDSLETLCKVLLFNDSGIFVSPYQRKIIVDNDQGIKYKLDYQLLDSITFVKYTQITKFSYQNNLEKKAIRNFLVLSIGTSLLIAPPLVYGLDQEKNLFSEPSNPIIMGVGAILTIYSIYRFKKNIKLKQVNLSEYSFNYTLE